MKKTVLAVVCALLCACAAPQDNVKRLEITGINEIEYTKLQSVMEEDVSFILYIGRTDCGDCQEFYPILEDYLEEHEGEGVYYLNIKSFRDAAKADDATEEEVAFYDNLSSTFRFNWVPTLEVISSGNVGKQYQYLDEDYYEIEDRAAQKERRAEFLEDFEDFMEDYYND